MNKYCIAVREYKDKDKSKLTVEAFRKDDFLRKFSGKIKAIIFSQRSHIPNSSLIIEEDGVVVFYKAFFHEQYSCPRHHPTVVALRSLLHFILAFVANDSLVLINDGGLIRQLKENSLNSRIINLLEIVLSRYSVTIYSAEDGKIKIFNYFEE